MKNDLIRIISIGVCIASLGLVSCSKKADETTKTENTASEQQVPDDPVIKPNALIGTWIQMIDDDPSVYTFLENGQCIVRESSNTPEKNCTYELKSPKDAGSRFNKIIMNFPASGDNEQYYTMSHIRISGDRLDFLRGRQ